MRFSASCEKTCVGTTTVWLLLTLALLTSVGYSEREAEERTNPGARGSRPGSAQSTARAGAKIYYGLNDSHSRSWVRENSDGVVGISYFQRIDVDSTAGSLIYQTIQPDGTLNAETVADGTRMEKSVLLYDLLSRPHIFVARSDSTDQYVDHYFKSDSGPWEMETVARFNGFGGKFIYEMSADSGPDGSFHLLVLKTRSDVDSDDYWEAWRDAYLFHISNATGAWQTLLIRAYNTAYTYDHYIKSSCRQDLKVDHDGFLHITFSMQIVDLDDPSILLYGTNRSGSWQFETALTNEFGSRDDAGWYPSLCLDADDTPYISCMYVNRVYTYSAVYCKLFLLKREGDGVWSKEVVAETDDGYYGTDGRRYTGALSHLVFDSENIPHIIFSDVASSHEIYQHLNVGNIRHAVKRNGTWDIQTIYHQPCPVAFDLATEMFGQCLVISDQTDTLRVIGQELEDYGWYRVCLLSFSWSDVTTDADNEPATPVPGDCRLDQNYPNPFNPSTTIDFVLPTRSVKAGWKPTHRVGHRDNPSQAP